MSSVTRFLKQIPTDTPYFTLASTVTTIQLSVWTPDGNASITNYASGRAAGSFAASTATVAVPGASIWRDMGKTIVSSGRTFRRIQQLSQAAVGSTEFSATGFVPNNEGVFGSASTTTADSGFGVFYFETGAYGQALTQPFVRYG
jgi:hypothetical protein